MFVKEFSKKKQEDHAKAEALVRGCNRFLSGNPRTTPAEDLAELAEYARNLNVSSDLYGIGEFLNRFEKEIASLLGMEAGIFMPSGVMAQGIALKIAAEESGCKHVAFHPTSHLEANEEHAYSTLHGLRATLLGDKASPFTAQDILSLQEPVSTILLELPYRRLGGALPSWEELEAIKSAAKTRGARLHMDGARLWESQPYYSRPLSEICRGFDSVYVSFYKGVGAITGAMLLGSENFIQSARIWQRRMGGNLHQLFPYVLSSKMSFDRRRDRFAQYQERAVSLAHALETIDGVSVRPSPPQAGMMHVLLKKSVSTLLERRAEIAREDRFWLSGFFESETPGTSLMEISVGDSTLALSDAEIVEVVRTLIL